MANDPPFFSVVIPVYNRAGSVVQAVDSVLAQTFQDFEVVIIDDGSTDGTADVIATVTDVRVRTVRQHNSGGASARNTGIDHATGRYIAFLDSDDLFLPAHLSSLRRALDDRQNIAVYSPVIVDRGNGVRYIKPERPLREHESMADYLMADRGLVPTSGLAVDSALARAVKYRAGLPFGQDTDFAIRLQLAGCRFEMTSTPTSVWNDTADPQRVSAARKGVRCAHWLEDMRPQISSRAYFAYRGWHVAKGLFITQKLLALWYFTVAAARGCYRPRLAATVLLQIVLTDSMYRKVSDRIISSRFMAAARKPG